MSRPRFLIKRFIREAINLMYTVANAANWISTPDNAKDALDELASRTKALEGIEVVDSHVVADQTEANALTDLKIGDYVYIHNQVTDLQARLQIVKGITDGDYTTSTIRDIAYNASGRVFKNEGTADLVTSFPGNNTNVKLRTRLTAPNPPIGGFQMVNTKGIISGDQHILEIDDPRGAGTDAGSPIQIYPVICNLSFRKSGGSSTFEFRFAKENIQPGAGTVLIVDSSRMRVTTNDVHHISFAMLVQLKHLERIAVYVERTAGGANLVTERHEVLIPQLTQQGYV